MTPTIQELIYAAAERKPAAADELRRRLKAGERVPRDLDWIRVLGPVVREDRAPELMYDPPLLLRVACASEEPVRALTYAVNMVMFFHEADAQRLKTPAQRKRASKRLRTLRRVAYALIEQVGGCGALNKSMLELIAEWLPARRDEARARLFAREIADE